jgi:hypothetical protein
LHRFRKLGIAPIASAGQFGAPLGASSGGSTGGTGGGTGGLPVPTAPAPTGGGVPTLPTIPGGLPSLPLPTVTLPGVDPSTPPILDVPDLGICVSGVVC